MGRILFLDLDGAPFTAFEMLALLERGHDVFYSGFRPVPERLKSGELAPLREREVVLGRSGLAAARTPGLGLSPVAVRALGTAIRAYAAEPRYLAALLATLGWTSSAAVWAKENGVGHLHANWAHLPATSAWIVSRSTAIPFSFSAHAGRDVFRTTALLRRKIADAAFVAACNREAVGQLIAIGGPEHEGKIHLRYHGIDLARFSLRAPAAAEYLLSVGNLDPAKGFDVAVRALARLREEGRRIRLRIVGEGPERPALERLAAGLGRADEIELAGALEGPALVEAYRGAAVLLAPSRVLDNGGRDGLPNVVLEAMAVGVPVAASRIAAIPEAVEHEVTGLLVPPEDPAALARAAARLLDDAPLAARLAEAARRRVAADFDRSANVERFCTLFASPD